MRKIHIPTVLIGLCFLWASNIPALEKQAPKFSRSNQPVPAHFAKFNQQSIRSFSVNNNALLTESSANRADYIFDFPLIDHPLVIQHQKMIHHSNGDISFNLQANIAQSPRQVIFTQGEGVGMGEIRGGGQHLYFEQRGDELFIIDIGLSGILSPIYENDVIGEISSAVISGANQLAAVGETQVIVDVMLLFTQNIVDEFPGEMTQVLLNQLVMRANQAFVDSDISVQLRLVHTQFVDYFQQSDLRALTDLDAALRTDRDGGIDPSLSDVAALRDQFGADIVSMIRTHDLNEREVCGVARFPRNGPLINISNVGISGGSNCLDTFTHEIGHNFGAGHQRVDNEPQGALPFAGAFVVSNKFNTIMTSAATGDANRGLRFNVFSNPNLQCGGGACGSAVVADNARIINEFAPGNAGLRPAVSTAVVVAPPKSSIDSDGDNTLDVNDTFPFDETEVLDSDLDGVGDNADQFPNNPDETIDTDNDGIGNNADSDDDNDGVEDIDDDLPLDANESVDSDGDGIGQNVDVLDNDFQDFLDFDGDGIGDKQDLDDDNDGVADFSPIDSLSTSEAWVASAGTGAIVRLNAETGDFVDTLIEGNPLSFSFRSDMTLSPSQQLFFIFSSEIFEYDPQIDEVRLIIDRSDLSSNFPGHIAFIDNDTLLISHGFSSSFAPSFVDSFSLSSDGNNLASSVSNNEVTRDVLVTTDNRLLIILRNSNRIVSVDLNAQDSGQVGVPFISEGLSLPEHMVADASGNIYVTNAGSGTVTQYNAAGDFLGVFITTGAGGLGEPSCITIGPEGDLYICSMDTNQILKFDGESGAFIEVFADSSNSQIEQPVSLVFAGLPLDELRLDGEHDTDGDGVNNVNDDLPQDSTETTDSDNDGIGNNADEDDDNDGMPDQFEIDNNFDPLNADDASEDADNDGSTNLQEFLAGTDPNSAASTPAPPTPPPQPTPPAPPVAPPVSENNGESGGGSFSGIALIVLILMRGIIRRKQPMKKVSHLEM